MEGVHAEALSKKGGAEAARRAEGLLLTNHRL